MNIFDITSTANYFGRVTGITRVEFQLAKEFKRKFPKDTRFVYWSNDKYRFELYEGELDFSSVKAAKLSSDYSCTTDNYCREFEIGISSCEIGNFIVTGSGWLQNNRYATGCISFAKTHSLKLSFYIHDLIPLKFPYYYNSSYVNVFADSLRQIVSSGALLLCNSENTRKDLLEWCQAQRLEKPQSSVAHLGDSILPEARNYMATEVGTENYVLAVGAIHRRKNYELLVAAWRRLRDRMGGRCPILKIVGGVTPDGKLLESEIRHDPIVKDSIEILQGIDDHALDQLYRNAKLVVYPSHYEGWGLPVAEALAYGKICLASNTSAIPEIADLGPDFIAPDDPVSWASRIMFYCQNEAQRIVREEQLKALYRPRTWEGTVNAIAAALANFEGPSLPTLYPGEEIAFDTSKSDLYLVSSCYAVEKWGRWCANADLKIGFILPRMEQRDLVLKIVLNIRENTMGKILLNGGEVFSGALLSGIHTYCCKLPEEMLEDENSLEVHSDIFLELPDKEKGKHQKRYSGLGIVSCGLLTKEQICYDLENSFGSPEVLKAFPLSSRDYVKVISGRLSGNAVKSQNGMVSLQLEKFSPVFWDMSALACIKLPKGKVSLATIRMNGKIIAQSMIRGDPLGNAVFPIFLQSEVIALSSLEIFLVDENIKTKQDFTLTEIYFPQPFTQKSDDPNRDQYVEVGDYLKFGCDVDDKKTALFAAGWNLEERFGVSCSNLGLISFVAGGAQKITKLKLNCKVVSRKRQQVTFTINGQTTESSLFDNVENVVIDLQRPMHPKDQASLQIAASQDRFVLRALQFL